MPSRKTPRLVIMAFVCAATVCAALAFSLADDPHPAIKAELSVEADLSDETTTLRIRWSGQRAGSILTVSCEPSLGLAEPMWGEFNTFNDISIHRKIGAHGDATVALDNRAMRAMWSDEVVYAIHVVVAKELRISFIDPMSGRRLTIAGEHSVSAHDDLSTFRLLATQQEPEDPLRRVFRDCPLLKTEPSLEMLPSFATTPYHFLNAYVKLDMKLGK